MKFLTTAKICLIALVLSACSENSPTPLAANISISAASDQVVEGDMVTLTITSDRSFAGDMSIPIEYGGTAMTGSDYQGSTRIVISAGQTSANLGLLIETDEIDEGDETIIVGFPNKGMPAEVAISEDITVTVTIVGEI